MNALTRKILASAITATVLGFGSSALFAAEKPYDGHVQCEGSDCKVDKYMIKGFRAFSQCQVCHGIDGNGSSFAPSLMQKLQEIDKATFLDRVTNGFKGQIGVMPPWKENPNVMNNVDPLYAYLKARSDKVLPSGRLARFDRGDAAETPAQAAASAAEAPAATAAAAKIEVQAPASGFGSRGNIQ